MILDLAKTVIGAGINSRAADKEARALREAQERALAAQRQAAGAVRDLYAPGVDAYYDALGALRARAGLGGGGGALDPAYGVRHPDLAAEAARVVGTGEFASPADYYAWQQQAYPDENRGSYLTGEPNALKDDAGGLSAGVFGGADDPRYAPPAAFGYGLADHEASPAYQYQLAQGIAAIEASQAARGAMGSGATLKALQRLGSGLGYQNFAAERGFAAGRYDADRLFDRGVYQNDRDYLTGRYDRQTQDLSQIAGYGQGAAGQTAAALSGVGQAGANAALGTGSANAANAAAQGNIWGGAVNGAFDALGAAQDRRAAARMAAPNALKAAQARLYFT